MEPNTRLFSRRILALVCCSAGTAIRVTRRRRCLSRTPVRLSESLADTYPSNSPDYVTHRRRYANRAPDLGRPGRGYLTVRPSESLAVAPSESLNRAAVRVTE